MFSRTGADAYKTDITNTVALCKVVGDPQNKIRAIHVAGTNGKGSVSHMLAAIFQQSGFKTGLYTSPHLKDFRERIKINGKWIEEEFIVSFVERIREETEKIEPSFFEVTVVMALKYFEEQNVDIAIIETGLGGRLDSTNVITPLLSIITNIGYDHMNILGDTLEKIAFEKAGIIKMGIPVVVGETSKETEQIFIKKAKECNSTITFADQEFSVTDYEIKINELNLAVLEKDTRRKFNYTLDLNGIYQQKNLVTVLASVQQLRKQNFDLKDENIEKALSSVKKLTGLYGRWDVIHEKPMIVLDVAHNEDGIRQLLKQVSLSTYNNLHIVFGMVKDKDADKILSLFPKEARYYFTRSQIPRALPENELLEKTSLYNLKGSAFPDVNEALKEAMDKASEDDLIVVCGSVFIVGEVNYLT